MIEIIELTKTFGEKTVIDNLSLRLANGESCIIVGDSLSGKSTLLKLICGVVPLTQGNVKINGYSITAFADKAKAQLGYLPSTLPLYESMTPYELLNFISQAKGESFEQSLSKINDILQLCELDKFKDTLISKLPKTKKIKLGIAQTLLGKSDILLLDSTLDDLDNTQISEIMPLLKLLFDKYSVILTSNGVCSLEGLCDNIYFLKNGKLEEKNENTDESV